MISGPGKTYQRSCPSAGNSQGWTPVGFGSWQCSGNVLEGLAETLQDGVKKGKKIAAGTFFCYLGLCLSQKAFSPPSFAKYFSEMERNLNA